MGNVQMQTLALKVAQVVTMLTGTAFTAFNLFSFKVVKNGYYFHDDNQTWLAVGVTSLAVSYIIKNWKNM